MKCPNCYSRNIDEQGICDLCGVNTKTFKTRRLSKKAKILLVLLIILFIVGILVAILGFNKIMNIFNNIPIFAGLKENYIESLKYILLVTFGFIGTVMMMRGSYIKSDNKKYDSYLLGKIIDYRPFKKGFYYPIIEYIVGEKEYRIVARPIEGKELDGLVGIKYEKNNPRSAIVDGEKNGDLFFFIGLVILVIVISIVVI